MQVAISIRKTKAPSGMHGIKRERFHSQVFQMTKWVGKNGGDETNLPEEISSKIKMRSGSMIAKRLESPETGIAPMGVILIESVRPRGVNGKHLRQLETDLQCTCMRQTILESMIPFEKGDRLQ